MTNPINLTEATHDVFMGLAETSQNEGREPEVTNTSNKIKGHLMNLKKSGLITTNVCDGDSYNVLWVGFTAKGLAYAKEHGAHPFEI